MAELCCLLAHLFSLLHPGYLSQCPLGFLHPLSVSCSYLLLLMQRTRNGGASTIQSMPQLPPISCRPLFLDCIPVLVLGCLTAPSGAESPSTTVLSLLCAPSVFWTCEGGKTEFQCYSYSLQDL